MDNLAKMRQIEVKESAKAPHNEHSSAEIQALVR
jgi:hypothetical protein